jgi:hypothetical protein
MHQAGSWVFKKSFCQEDANGRKKIGIQHQRYSSFNAMQFPLPSDWWLLRDVLRRSFDHFGAIDWQTGDPLTAGI